MKKTVLFITIGLTVLLASCSAAQQAENTGTSNSTAPTKFHTALKKQLDDNYTAIKQKTADADTALKQAEEKPSEKNYTAAEAAINAVPYKVIELTSRLKAIRTTLDDLQKAQETADSSTSPANSQPGNAANEQSAQDRYWEAVNNGASPEAARAYADGWTDSYEETPSEETQSSEAAEPTTLTEFINQYGMTPVSYKVQVEGMSVEEALRSTPREMKTSGELQTGYTKYGIND